jgi:hypothetical protein
LTAAAAKRTAACRDWCASAAIDVAGATFGTQNAIAFMLQAAENGNMVLHGRIEHGTVVLTDNVSLPDGTEVTVVVEPRSETTEASHGQRVNLPLVSSKQPGSRTLTANRIAEILDDDDLSG